MSHLTQFPSAVAGFLIVEAPACTNILSYAFVVSAGSRPIASVSCWSVTSWSWRLTSDVAEQAARRCEEPSPAAARTEIKVKAPWLSSSLQISVEQDKAGQLL
jgi:hypothetical protein